MKRTNRLGELLDKIKLRTGYSIKQVAEKLGGDYKYNTLRNEKWKRKPSDRVIKKIEEVFKEELRDTPLKNYTAGQQTDNLTVEEDQVPYGDKGKVVSRLKLIRKNLIQLTSDVDEVLKEIGDSKSGDEQVKESAISQPEQKAGSSKTTSTQPASDKTTFYTTGKKKSKKKDTDLPTPSKRPEE